MLTQKVPIKLSTDHAGFDAAGLDDAISFAIQNESKMNRDIAAALADGHFEEPWPIRKVIGPVKSRKDPNGLVMQNGRIVASWGETDRVDMTFSISKSYLSLCAGIAVDDGLIPDINAPVRELVDDDGFEDPQNRHITWAQMLQLTSEWHGTLWGKPDWIDHNRNVSNRSSAGAVKGTERKLRAPGTYWEYNDVRVNRLSLALLRVFQRPLPEVLKERIMDPIGATDSWIWHGYDNSYVEMGGKMVQSVSGGAHWGGGLWINSLDHARIGQLFLNGGTWEGQEIVSQDWISACCKPCPLYKNYGYLWWLNHGRELYGAASPSSVFALGVGTNMIWIDPDHDLVVVARWLQKERVNGFIKRMMNALN